MAVADPPGASTSSQVCYPDSRAGWPVVTIFPSHRYRKQAIFQRPAKALSETDGLTSGAVQPPGSTGEESRSDYVVSSELGEESGGSYSDEEVFTAALQAEELEDEEQRLIKQGGTGIPIGPVSPCHTSRLQTLPDLPAGWKTEAFATSHNPKI